MEDMNVDEDIGTIGLGCALELFSEFDEVMEMISKLPTLNEKQRETAYQRFHYILSLYQEQPHLLDPHLDRMLNELVNIVRIKENSMAVKHDAFAYLHVIMKVRGYKVVVQHLPHEVSDVEPVLQMLESQDASDKEHWQTRFVLILWLSIIVMIPFHMSRLDSFDSGECTRKTVMERVLEICKKYTVNDMFKVTALLTSRFLTRMDVRDIYLVPYFDWAKSVVKDANSTDTAKCGCMAGIAAILKHGKREDLLTHAYGLLRFLVDLKFGDSPSHLLRCLAIKTVQRIGLTFLKPRVAPWRYNRGCRSLAANLQVVKTNSSPALTNSTPLLAQQQFEDNSQAEDDEDVDVPDELEDVIELLAQGLRDSQTPIRWSAAKGIGRVTGRLPKELADEVVGTVLQLFSPREPHTAWHGGCLALAELGRRGLLLPSRLPTAVPLVIHALTYDEPRGSTSVGSLIRDAACYVCWSFARAYDRDVLAPFVKDIAATLLVVASFDREINCRRAASAAFQENVGRQGTFPHGIEILTTADFFAVSVRANAYLNISAYIAQFEEYTLPLIDHLIERKVDHWDIAIRELAAKALHNLTPRAPEYMATRVMDKLLSETASIDMKVRHGTVLAIAEIIHAFSLLPSNKTVEDYLGKEKVERIRDLVPQFHKRLHFRGMGGELLKQACSHMIEKCSLAHMPFHGTTTIDEWQELLDLCLSHDAEVIRLRACAALPAFFGEYYQGPNYSMHRTAIVTRYLKQLEASDQTTRMGYSMALGSFPKFMLEGKVSEVLTSLIRCSSITETTLNWSESRRDAIRAATAVCLTVGAPALVQCEKSLVDTVLECFLTGLKEYTMDSRGDIGAWVREASLSGLQTLILLLSRESPDALKPGMVHRAMVGVTQQCLEKIDRVRAHAGRVFFALLHSEPPVPGIPDCNDLRRVFPDHNWKSDSETYSQFCQLLPLPAYTAAVLCGVMVCMGDITIRLMRNAGSALITHMQQVRARRDAAEILRLGRTMADVWRLHLNVERFAVPIMNAMNQLLASGCLDLALLSSDGSDGSDLSQDLLELALAEVSKIGRNQNRISAVIGVLCQLIQVPGTVRRRALTRLSIFLCYSFLWARKVTAGQLYEALLVYGEDLGTAPDVDVEAAMELLSDTAWDGPIEEVRPVRNEVCRLLGIPAPRVVTKGAVVS